MAKVDFKRVKTNAEVNNIDIKDGNFIVTGEGKTFIDYENERKAIGGTPDIEMSDTSTNSVENRVIKQYVDENSIKNILPEVIFEGKCLFANNVIRIDEKYKKIDVYICANDDESIYPNTYNKYILPIDTSENNYDFTIGDFCAMSGTNWIEIEMAFSTNRILRAEYCGIFKSFNSQPIYKTNNQNFYVYKVIGYK